MTAAQYVVRTHNRIVRSALVNYMGREIKHTGDGIMASFTTVSNAVEAAVETLRRVAANNAAEGDIPLHLRIGINAGEPVIEDDDLFGVTVQLAARLCAAAEADQILVSEWCAPCARQGDCFNTLGRTQYEKASGSHPPARGSSAQDDMRAPLIARAMRSVALPPVGEAIYVGGQDGLERRRSTPSAARPGPSAIPRCPA
jgi:hypothetical protein